MPRTSLSSSVEGVGAGSMDRLQVKLNGPPSCGDLRGFLSGMCQTAPTLQQARGLPIESAKMSSLLPARDPNISTYFTVGSSLMQLPCILVFRVVILEVP